MAKTLIAFFSRADENYFGGAMRYVKVGNTEIVAGIIEDLILADTFKIEMKNPYSPVYMTCIEEAKKDLRAKARPELVSMPESIDEYDTVILAYPNYWGTMPMAVYTFLENFDFSGKTILPLCTNEGSGMGSSEREIKKTCPGADVKKGLPITGSAAASSKSSVERWLKANGLIATSGVVCGQVCNSQHLTTNCPQTTPEVKRSQRSRGQPNRVKQTQERSPSWNISH